MRTNLEHSSGRIYPADNQLNRDLNYTEPGQEGRREKHDIWKQTDPKQRSPIVPSLCNQSPGVLARLDLEKP